MRDVADRLSEENAAVPELIFRFHDLLTQAAGNSIFTMVFRAFEPVLMVLITRHYSLQAVDLKEAAAMHRELLDHIEAKDPDAAAACMERILSQGVSVLERRYRKSASSSES